MLITLREWGVRHYGRSCGEKQTVVDRVGRSPILPVEIRAADGRALKLDELQLIEVDPVEASSKG